MPATNEPDLSLLCPSAQADWQDSVAIGVVGGTAAEPRVSHFPDALPVDEDLLTLVEAVTPGEVLRIAAPCLCSGCMHYDDDTCHLAERIVDVLPPVTRRLPRCSIRPRCRWWRQEGPAACTRCPQIVTDNLNPSADMRRVAGGAPDAPHRI